ncbi:LIM and SH3 domain protein Lasp-like [Actinia tenebrosa]|uniref:LIM and SH3 domain protein Lasp-like n=1 Tax=Actinia tenebrosa TaxID=6105 RepID=A0A6P8J598_ACTTE|nr:LIM and SH3 domain protein Lasp-like [Actinia tenebrosa]
MNPQCAKCLKTVYPVEKLNCLDKIWHKGCFKCTECGMTLNMKNYKGYNKFPYCQAHYPQTKHTVVADSVENRRLTQQSKQQSQVEYQKQFHEDKGHYTAISDDPETLRNLKVSHNISNVAYHNERGPRSAARDPRQAVAGQPPPPQVKRKVSRYVAMYDYIASAADEVSIMEGDVITNVEKIDDGWMEGRVQRSGKYGMFPANYVKPM